MFRFFQTFRRPNRRMSSNCLGKVVRRMTSVERLEPRFALSAGELDETFGDGGGAFLDFAGRLDFVSSVAVQTDQMIVVAGQAGRLEGFTPHQDLAVVRLDGDGELDPDFGDGGIFLADLGDANGRANSVAVQTDGKLVVAGEIQSLGQFVLLRLETDGSPDLDFGVEGEVVSDLALRANDVVIQPDGKIVIVGDTDGPVGPEVIVVRFEENGDLDSSFGDEGVERIPFLETSVDAAAVALQSDGGIIVAGHTVSSESGLASVMVARLLGTDGSLDDGFGVSGIVSTQVVLDSKASDVAVDDNDRVVVVGSDSGSLVLARYKTDGSLDETFNTSGTLVIDDLNPVVGGTTRGGVVIQPDGKLVVTSSGGNDFVLLRLEPDGSLDETFNGVGKVVTDFAVTFNSSEAVALQEDGAIVVAGITGADWTVARFLGDPPPAVWQNAADPLNVSGDVVVVPFDVLLVINELNLPRFRDSQGKLPLTRPTGAPFFDANGDGFVTPLDALLVINFLNTPAAPTIAGGEAAVDDLDGQLSQIAQDTLAALYLEYGTVARKRDQPSREY